MVDLHRHDEFSTFDGFGSAKDCAEAAKALGYTSLGLTNHGNTNGLVRHYKACRDVGIKPILGVETYFTPVKREGDRGDHLCLFAKNLKGYENINRLQWEGEHNKFYNPIITFSDLKKYHDGIICSTACLSGTLAKYILAKREDLALRFLNKMKNIFGEDFYIEVQPYSVDEEGTQEKVNLTAMWYAAEVNVKCILTSDSHRPKEGDIKSYLKMHEIAGHNMEHIYDTYKDRYMPSEGEIKHRFCEMHGDDFDNMRECFGWCREAIEAMQEIEDKVEPDILDQLNLVLPRYEDKTDSAKVILDKVKEGLRKRPMAPEIPRKEYIARCKHELEVINHHGLADYFLMVSDYVNYARDHKIAVGPGRGSGCNCQVNYFLGITDVDSLFFNLNFERFLRKDKLKFPDIDVDFETERRKEVIDYMIEKYSHDKIIRSAKICSYGLYKTDNLINDLAKTCGLKTGVDVDEWENKENKKTIADIKKLCNYYIDDDKVLDKEKLLSDRSADKYNRDYDDIILHFTKLYQKVRYIGTHAAGVAITGDELLKYTALRMDKEGNIYTAYDLNDIESINVIKFDVLGLKTLNSIKECEQLTGESIDNIYDFISDKKILDAFRSGETDGIFQLEKNTAKEILRNINCDCFEDVIATTSMNRPVPLKLGVPELYANNKYDIKGAADKIYYSVTKDSYGTIIYQEQLIRICKELAEMDWQDIDKLMKIIKKPINEKTRPIADELKRTFVKNMVKKYKVDKDDMNELFEGFLAYLFNKGHATGYSLITFKEMFYKVYYPLYFWYVKVKYAGTDEDYAKFCEQAVKSGVVVFLPHVNYSQIKTSLKKIDGEFVIMQGLSDIKGIGEKAAEYIVNERKENGIFRSYDDFFDRCKSRTVTKKVDEKLKETGAAVFNKNLYIKAVKKYNSALYSRAVQK